MKIKVNSNFKIKVGDVILLENGKVYMIIKSIDKNSMMSETYRLLNLNNGHTIELEEWKSISSLTEYVFKNLEPVNFISNSNLILSEERNE